jgi:BR serine/threonine kinase
MPASFPHDVQELVSRIIVIDPSARATLAEIKAHRCFRRDLRPNYILPAPIPCSQFTSAIELSSLGEEVIAVLRQIGYADEEELASDLRASHNSMAKVFVALLLTNAQFDLDGLPWECAYNTTASSYSPGAVMDTDKSVGSLVEDPFREQRIFASPGSPLGGGPLNDACSFVHRPDWYEETTSVGSVLYETSKEVYGMTNWRIMEAVQQAVGDCGLQYFHPDPVTIHARTVDGLFYVTVFLSFKSKDEIMVNVQLHKGSVDQFGDFSGRLFQTMCVEEA